METESWSPMTISARDQVLQRARAKAKRIDTALAAIDALSDDEAEIVYAKLEERVVQRKVHAERPTTKKQQPTKASSSKRACGACGKPGHNARTCPTATGRAPTKVAKPADRYADRARKLLAENPQGLRTYEIGEKIGQTVPNAFGTLKLLERLGQAERHGSRNNTLWTVPGGTPVPRVETIAAAVVQVLTNARKAVDAWVLRDTVAEIITEATGKKPRLDSVTAELGRLVGKDIITTNGTNEHGPLYVLVREGGADASTLN